MNILLLYARRTVLSLFVFSALALMSQTISAQITGVTVFTEWVDYDASTNILTAYYGYNNTNTAANVIPVGGNNYFQPSPFFRGQPTTFQPGINHFVYSTTLDLSNRLRDAVCASPPARCE